VLVLTGLLILLFAFVALPVKAVDFTAELYTSFRDTSVTDKIYVSGNKYRMVQDPGRGQGTTTIVVDQDAGFTIVMLDRRKEYNYMPSDAGQSLMNDPIQALAHTAGRFTMKPLGKETINGYECDKRVYMADTLELVVEWFSPKLNFPMKVQSLRYGLNERLTELRYVIEGPLDPSLFTIPAGYARFKGQPLRLPEWEAKLSEAPVHEVPYYGQLKKGEIVRFKTLPGKTLLIQANTPDDKPSDASAVPFKDGKPVGDVSAFRLYNIRGDIWLPMSHTSAEADEIVVGSNNSDLTVEVKTYDQYEKLLSVGEELSVPLKQAEKSEFRAMNVADEASDFEWTFYKGEQALSDAETKPAKFRHWTLRDPNEVDARPFDVFGDRVVFKVTKGKVLIKVNQYDPSLM